MIIDLLNVRAWALDGRFIDRVFPVAMDMFLKGHDLSSLIQDKEAALFPTSAGYDSESRLSLFQAANGKRVGMFRISGGLTKTGDLCSYGTRDYARLIEQANASKSIDAIVIEMDTPGGSVDGTPELGIAIKNSEKPVVVFADNLLASAGYWVASQASAIIANANNYTEVGSIGTLFVYPNYANLIEAGNFPNVKIIRAPQSVDKAQVNMFEPLTEELETEVKDDLRKVTEDFIKTITSGRGDKLNAGDENIFTGKLYGSDEALKMGMIDAIGARQDAVDRAGRLAEEKADSSRSLRTKTDPAVSGNTSTMKFKMLSSLFGQAGQEATEELSADERTALEAAEQRLTAQQEELAANATRIAELETQLNERGQLIDAQSAEIADLRAQLEKAPAGHATTIIHAEDEFGDSVHRNTSYDMQKQELKKFKTN